MPISIVHKFQDSCALCKNAHRYGQTEYFDDVLNWDYILEYKFSRLPTILQKRKEKKKRMLMNMEMTYMMVLKHALCEMIDQETQMQLGNLF